MCAVRRFSLIGLACVLLTAYVSADTIFLRDGRRIDGLFVGADSRTIEFDAEQRNGRLEHMRVDRRDVLRIEFEDPRREEPPVVVRSEPNRRPTGLREKVMSVDGKMAWSESGIDVREGQNVYFDASGLVTWAPGKRDGPGGQSNSKPDPNRPIQSKPNASLIGRIGAGSHDYFFIGEDQGPIRMRASGRLYLGINDSVLTDNGSSFRVVIYY